MTPKLALTIVQVLCGLILIAVVMLQSGKSAGLSGAIGGVADSFLARNKAKTWDAKLARATKWVGAVFLILTLILLILQGGAGLPGSRGRRWAMHPAAVFSIRPLSSRGHPPPAGCRRFAAAPPP